MPSLAFSPSPHSFRNERQGPRPEHESPLIIMIVIVIESEEQREERRWSNELLLLLLLLFWGGRSLDPLIPSFSLCLYICREKFADSTCTSKLSISFSSPEFFEPTPSEMIPLPFSQSFHFGMRGGGLGSEHKWVRVNLNNYHAMVIMQRLVQTNPSQPFFFFF